MKQRLFIVMALLLILATVMSVANAQEDPQSCTEGTVYQIQSLGTATCNSDGVLVLDQALADGCRPNSAWDADNPFPFSSEGRGEVTTFPAFFSTDDARNDEFNVEDFAYEYNRCGWLTPPHLPGGVADLPAFLVSLPLPEGIYSSLAISARIYLDLECEGLGESGTLVADHENGATFAVDTESDGPACATIISDGGVTGGVSLMWEWRLTPAVSNTNGNVRTFSTAESTATASRVTLSNALVLMKSEDESRLLVQIDDNQFWVNTTDINISQYDLEGLPTPSTLGQ